MMAGRCPNRHHPHIRHQTTGEPAGEASFELVVVLEVTLATVPTFEPAATPHQRGAAAAHPQVTNPLRPPVPHPIAAEPTMAAPRPLPSRFDLHLKTLNRVDPHSRHANTRQVQPYLHNIRHRGLSLDRRCWLFTDSSGASPPFQGFHPTQPTMLLCFTNRLVGVEPLLVSGSEVVVVGEASLELG